MEPKEESREAGPTGKGRRLEESPGWGREGKSETGRGTQVGGKKCGRAQARGQRMVTKTAAKTSRHLGREQSGGGDSIPFPTKLGTRSSLVVRWDTAGLSGAFLPLRKQCPLLDR